MPARVWPADPAFVNDAERVVWQAVRPSLRDHDVLLSGLRLTDPIEGDVEIDLLVLFPDRGAIVIEVKGGHVTYAGGAVRQTGATGVHPIEPADQAAGQVRALQRFLERQPDWSRGQVRASWLVALPYTDVTADLGPQLPRSVVVDRTGLPDTAGRAHDRLADPALQRPVPAEGWVDAALGHLLGTLDEPGEIRARAAQRLQHVEELTARHASLLSAIREIPRYQVVGSAGTGKTWMAIEQARRWAGSGERVGLLTYTRGVAEAMRRSFADAPARERPRFVGTYFQLADSWGIRPETAPDPDFWDRRGPAALVERGRRADGEPPFTALVVDEAQDLADGWWPGLLANATPCPRIAVFRDDEQAVFADRRGHPDVDLVPLVLDENLRNARQIVDTFRPLIQADPTCLAGLGFPVEYVPCEPGRVIEAADDVVCDLTDRRGWLPEHVALLTTRHRHPVQAEFDADKDAYWSGLWEDDAVFYSTVAGFKGLERPAVVLAVDGFHDGPTARSVLYAGMSRARDLLVVVGPPELIEASAGAKVLRRLARRSRASGDVGSA